MTKTVYYTSGSLVSLKKVTVAAVVLGYTALYSTALTTVTVTAVLLTWVWVEVCCWVLREDRQELTEQLQSVSSDRADTNQSIT